jgi:hypothetical protein
MRLAQGQIRSVMASHPDILIQMLQDKDPASVAGDAAMQMKRSTSDPAAL